MLSIYAPIDFHEQLSAILGKEDRLHELVRIVDYLEERPVPSADNLLVKRKEIWPLIDWYNLLPPFILPESLPLDDANLLGLVFAKLGNYEKANTYLSKSNPTLQLELDFINRLQHALPISPDELIGAYSPFEEYRLMHNQAVVLHYAASAGQFDLDKAKYFYLEAIQASPTDEYRAYTARQFALLLTDTGETQDAERLSKCGIGWRYLYRRLKRNLTIACAKYGYIS